MVIADRGPALTEKAAAALASFPFIERRRRQPMFDLALLRSRRSPAASPLRSG